MKTVGAIPAAFMLGWAVVGSAGAAPFERNFYSADQVYDATTGPVFHGEYLETDTDDIAVTVRRLFDYPGADLAGVHEFDRETLLFAGDQTVELLGQVITPRDVAQFIGANSVSLAFEGSAFGVPAGVKIDAVTVVDDRLVLSFDQAVVLHGVALAHNDLVRIDGPGAVTRVFRAVDFGVPPAADLDAVSIEAGTGRIFLSLDVPADLGDLAIDDDDLAVFNPSDGTWQMARQQDSTGAWLGVDLDAFYGGAIPVLPDLIFLDGFEGL